MLEGLLYAGLVDIAVHGCFKRGAVGCSHVQARGAPARSPHRLWCLDSRRVMAHTPNNIFCQAFLLQRWELFWSAWAAFYFAPHLFVLFWCVVGMLVPTPKAYKSKAKNGTSASNGKQE